MGVSVAYFFFDESHTQVSVRNTRSFARETTTSSRYPLSIARHPRDSIGQVYEGFVAKEPRSTRRSRVQCPVSKQYEVDDGLWQSAGHGEFPPVHRQTIMARKGLRNIASGAGLSMLSCQHQTPTRCWTSSPGLRGARLGVLRHCLLHHQRTMRELERFAYSSSG